MSNPMPRDFTVNGIKRFGITLAGPPSEPLQENTEEYTAVSLASPIPPTPPNTCLFSAAGVCYPCRYLHS